MDLSTIRRNEQAEVEGVWFPIDKTTRLKIARAYTKKYGDLFKDKTRDYRFMMENEMLDEEISAEIMADIMSQCVLLDWEGLTINGEDIPYSQVKAYEILKDPVYRDFAKMVDSMSKDVQAYRDSQVDAAAKNSESTSDGT